jgi:hypothetical protein
LLAHELAFIQFNVKESYHVHLTQVFQDLSCVDFNWLSCDLTLIRVASKSATR